MAMMNPHVTALVITLLFLSSAQLSFSVIDFHQLLATYNLPKYLIPSEIKSYSLSTEDNTFTVELSSDPCYVRLTGLVFHYDRVIRGKLGFGNVSDVSGIQVRQLLFWASISGFVVEGDTIEYSVGFLTEKTYAKDFETVHSCRAKPKGVPDQLAGYAMRAVV